MTDVHERLRGFWDEDAKTYDLTPNHALSDPVEAAAWRAALRRSLPPPPAHVLDAGAGTGAISLLLAELGYRVTALDLSPGMLGHASQKAEARGLVIETVIGPASEPPPGPFDAVVERHLLWTLPEPAGTLSAWRHVAPEGRLLLFEGIWHRPGSLARLQGAAADALGRLLGAHHDHHASYDQDLLASLPLARAASPRPLLEAVAAAGWRRVRIDRLRDVEWARRGLVPFPQGWLEHHPQFAVIADA